MTKERSLSKKNPYKKSLEKCNCEVRPVKKSKGCKKGTHETGKAAKGKKTRKKRAGRAIPLLVERERLPENFGSGSKTKKGGGEGWWEGVPQAEGSWAPSCPKETG